jgi:N-acetylglucosamine kinase-like BadF-type ATPase
MNYLGIDGGGTKTVCVVIDAQGVVLGRGEAGASNYQSIGINAAFKTIAKAIQQAIETIKLTEKIEIQGICLGLAGVGRPRDIEVVQGIVNDLQNNQNLPIAWNLQPNNILICNDALISLVGGIGHDVGIVVAAGTGAIVFGRNEQGVTKRVGGWGYIIGDEGSAYKIAIAGMQAAMQSYDGREKPTRLNDAFINYLAIDTIEDIIEVVYRRGWGVKEIAALAMVVDNMADEGDEVAMRIIDEAIGELVKATSIAIEALNFGSSKVFEIVTTGSVWRGKSNIRKKFIASINTMYPYASVILPRYEPAYGAGLLAVKGNKNFNNSSILH